MNSKIRIGTRGSRMALIQARHVEDEIKAACPDVDTEIVVIKTTGDWRPGQGETRLNAIDGGKGLFAKEIESALLTDKIDIGVHSVKDMPSFLPEGLVMEHYIEREDSRDAFLSEKYASFNDLPAGAVVGTSSVRRKAFLLLKRPDIKVVPLRGNVPTRIEKMRSGQVDACILSYAGLCRIGLKDKVKQVFQPHELVPACGQGTIGIEYKEGREGLKEVLDQIHHTETGLLIEAERAVLQSLDGSCESPIGVHASRSSQDLFLVQCVVSRLDGSEFWHAKEGGKIETVAQAIELGGHVADLIKKDVDPRIFEGD